MEKHKRLIAIGDIHGCYHTMCDLFKQIDYSSETDTLVFIGDYIDRGPYSAKVVETIRLLQRQLGRDKVICLRGNHEKFAIDTGGFLDQLWAWNGGMYTIMSYDDNPDQLKSDIAWFRSLPLYYETDDTFFCHAGLTHPHLADNSEDDLLWGRDWIFDDERKREKFVVFGHTPSDSGMPYKSKSGDLCIDGGCVYDGNLCAYVKDLNTGEVKIYGVSKSKEDEKGIEE